MKITAILCVVSAAVVIAMMCLPAAAMAPPASQPADDQPATLPADSRKLMPIVRAETVAQALDYSNDEKIILEDVSDDGQLSTAALYVLLRRAEMLPAGPAAAQEAEKPNLKSFWREPERYRGRLVSVEARYGERAEPWPTNVTLTRWWGRRDVWLVDVLVEVKKTKPPTYERMVVVMGHEPPKNLSRRQPLRVVGLFYKLAKLREDAEKGDPNKKNEYPIIVAATLLTPAPAENNLPAGVFIMLAIVVAMLFVFMRLRRKVVRQRAAGREYQPQRFEDAADAQVAPGNNVDEELRRQVESYQAEKASKDADNT